MWPFLLALLVSIQLHAQTPDKNASAQDFKFHLNSEPKSLDPAQVSMGDSAVYLYANIYRGLYVYENSKLIPVGAKSCTPLKLKLRCRLNTSFKWSDGKTVVASEYVAAYRHLLSIKSKSSIIRILKNLKNANKIFTGEMKETDLGVYARSNTELEFEFDQDDPEFLYTLVSPLVAPIRTEVFPDEGHAAQLLVTGPYKIESWIKGKRIILVENPQYTLGAQNKPKVEIMFVDDDLTALALYDDQKLNFLKTLPTAQVEEYRSHAGFTEISMARFDYIGFSPELKQYPKLREALARSLNFAELQKMFFSYGIPGCSSLPDSLVGKNVCVSYDLEEAKKAFATLPDDIKQKRIRLSFSNYARDDVLRAMQWAAQQWQLHLGLNVEIQKLESGVFNSLLKTNPPEAFRKSVLMDRPTCLAAVENFTKNGSESFLKLDSEKLEMVVNKLANSRSEKDKKKYCSQALHELLDSYDLIGLGQIHFTMLISPDFTGWTINENNVLDLSRLRYKQISKATTFK